MTIMNQFQLVLLCAFLRFCTSKYFLLETVNKNHQTALKSDFKNLEQLKPNKFDSTGTDYQGIIVIWYIKVTTDKAKD